MPVSPNSLNQCPGGLKYRAAFCNKSFDDAFHTCTKLEGLGLQFEQQLTIIEMDDSSILWSTNQPGNDADRSGQNISFCHDLIDADF